MDFRSHYPHIDLDGDWSFAYSEKPVEQRYRSAEQIRQAGYTIYPAKVPGNFELDMLANGLIPEPFSGMNIAALRKYERATIWYFRTFRAPAPVPGQKARLIFEGVDCFAEVFLNGHPVCQCDNMLVPHVAAVTRAVREENELFVRIDSALEAARSVREYPPGLSALGSGYESLYVRKAPHMYGWDIMPRALTAGLWRSVTLRFLPEERLGRLWLETLRIAPDHRHADLALHYRVRTAGDPADVYEVIVEGVSSDSRFEHRCRLAFDAGVTRFGLPDPRLWWPRGRGEANLYAVQVHLLKNGERLDTMTFNHGIRTIALDRTSVTDEAGSGDFCFRVNGERIFVLGTNWVPVDAYHSRDVERIPQIMELVDEIGCNAIRCWGGNVYENDLFYDICDRKGILVWQDFAMACGIYPQDSTFQARLAQEARSVIRRLRQHACLALWAGDNECDQAYLWGGQPRDPNSNVLTRQVLPRVLREEDPSRPYLPSSPYMDAEAFKAGARHLPEDHLWGTRQYYKGAEYTGSLCHFASEIGYHGCPASESLRRFISPDKLWPYQNNEEWLLHSTSPLPGIDLFDYRVELMAQQVRILFGSVPDNLDDFAFASQVSQAEAMKFFVEMFRMAKWRRTGIIWWNIIDGWPQLSDAVVDYYFAKKLAYDYIKRSQSPVCVMLREPVDGEQEVVVCNDTRNNVGVSFVVHDVDSGALLLAGDPVASADSVTSLGRISYDAATQRFLAIEWETTLGRCRSHYLSGKPPFDLERYRRWVTEDN